MSSPAEPALAINSPTQARPLGERLAATPRLACEALARAIDARDLDGALACFAPGACLVWTEGTAAQGADAIRARLAELIAHGAEVEFEVSGVLVAGDLALAHERWQISYGEQRFRSPESASPTLVLRLLEGEWKLAIAAPWGLPARAPLEAVWP